MHQGQTAQTPTNGARMMRGQLNRPPTEIVFAEEHLRVVDMWNELDKVTEDLGSLYNRKTLLLGAIAAQVEKCEEREREILLKIIGENSGDSESVIQKQSVAARERAIKEELIQDDLLAEMNSNQRGNKSQLEILDVDIREAEKRHASLLARIKAAAAYMDFLRSARDARTAVETVRVY